MGTIQYATNTSTGLVVSRVGSELAWPMLRYDDMSNENNYTIKYQLEKISVFSITVRSWLGLKWTRKIPKAIKNTHRMFWGFSLLK